MRPTARLRSSPPWGLVEKCKPVHFWGQKQGGLSATTAFLSSILSYSSYVARQKQATVRRGTAAGEVLAPLNTPPSPSSFPLLIVSGLHVIPRDGFKPSELEITIRRRKRSIFLRTLVVIPLLTEAGFCRATNLYLLGTYLCMTYWLVMSVLK